MTRTARRAQTKNKYGQEAKRIAYYAKFRNGNSRHNK